MDYGFAVYEPPEPGLPYLAVVLQDGKVVDYITAPSAAEANALLKELAVGLAEAEADTRWLQAGPRD
ncbi:hypothetical protein ABEG18_17840 [Alsobacter sp. KACC 23698]|uniref:Uncharacterized protein n=1 Tax=Alsobacter sp. KACC 23698 TaxID=3149229 RepID=A0AAU7JB77_9HYPH